MRIIAETFVRLVIFCGMFVGVGMTKPKTPPPPARVQHTGMSNLSLCLTKTVPSFLCDRVTNTSPSYECVLCVNPSASHCLASTAVYCVRSCDTTECVARR